MKVIHFFLDPFLLLFKNRNMIWQTTLNDIKSRYAGSFMGLIWAVLYPLLFLSCYACVYIFIFNTQYEGFTTYEYIILIFCGLVPFIGFSEALSSGTPCVVGNAGLMKNTLFPIELVPVKTVLGSSTIEVCGLGLVLIALVVLNKLSVFTPLVLVMIILQNMFNIGMIWFFSSVNVIARDFQNIIGVITIFLMMVSPIAYPVDSVPDMLRPFLKLNPLYYIISSFQDVLILQRAPRMDTFIPFVIMTFTVYILGYHFFMRLKGVFVDNA